MTEEETRRLDAAKLMQARFADAARAALSWPTVFPASREVERRPRLAVGKVIVLHPYLDIGWQCEHAAVGPKEEGQTVVCEECLDKVNDDGYVCMTEEETKSPFAAAIYHERVAAAQRGEFWWPPAPPAAVK